MSETTASLEQALAHASRLMASDPALAGEQASEILKVSQGHPMALLLLGVSHAARGQAQSAADILQPLALAGMRRPGHNSNSGWRSGGSGAADARALGRRSRSSRPAAPGARSATTTAPWAMPRQPTAQRGVATVRDGLLQAASASGATCPGRGPAARPPALPPTDRGDRMLAELGARLGRDDDAAPARTLPATRAEFPRGAAPPTRWCSTVPSARGERSQVDQLLAIEPANAGYRNQRAAILCKLGEYGPALEIYADGAAVRDMRASG